MNPVTIGTIDENIHGNTLKNQNENYTTKVGYPFKSPF